MSDVDLDRLADFVGGALDGTPAETVVRDLVANEPSWAEAYTRLVVADSTVRAGLRSFGGARPVMPPDVTERIRAALTAAADDTRVTDATDHTATAHDTVRLGRRSGGPSERRSRDRRPQGRPGRRVRRRWTVAVGTALAAAVCGLVAVWVPSLTGDGHPTADGAQQAAGSGADRTLATAPDTPVVTTASGTDYTRSTLVPAAEALAGREKAHTQASVDALSGPDSGPAAEAGEGTDDAAPAGGDRAEGVSAASGDGATLSRAPAELAPLTGRAGLASCLGAVVERHGGKVVAVDFARFEGRPAVITVLRGSPESAGGTLIVVVGPGCGQHGGTTDERYMVAG